MTDTLFLFVYGSLLPGEVHASHLDRATHLGAAATVPGYRLVELEQYPVLIESGDMSIQGELYELSRDDLRRIDELKENGRLFFRREIELAGGRKAQTYLMDEDKLRGRRRLRSNDWRNRFAPLSSASARRNPLGGWRR